MKQTIDQTTMCRYRSALLEYTTKLQSEQPHLQRITQLIQSRHNDLIILLPCQNVSRTTVVSAPRRADQNEEIHVHFNAGRNEKTFAVEAFSKISRMIATQTDACAEERKFDPRSVHAAACYDIGRVQRKRIRSCGIA